MLLVLVAFALPAWAQRSTFHPEVRLEAGWDDNVDISPEGEAESDETTRIAVRLPWVRKWRSGQFSMAYEPSYERYRNRSELDNDAHRLTFGVVTDPSRKTSLIWDASVQRTQVQGDPAGTTSPDLTVIGRTERDSLQQSIETVRRIGRRTEWTVGLSQSAFRFTPIEDVPADPTVSAAEDRAEYHLASGFRWSTSERDSLGFEVTYARFDLDVSGSEDVAGTDFVWIRRLARTAEIEARIGVVRREPDFDPAVVVDPTANETITEGAGSVRMSKNYRSSSLSLVAQVQPSSGGSLSGTSTDSGIAVAWIAHPSTAWTAGTTVRYALRSPRIESLGDTESLGGSVSVEWRPIDKLGVRLTADYTDQSSSENPALDRTQTRAALGLVWYPRGTERSSAGGTL